MSKSTIKRALLLGAVGGLVMLGYHAQKYVRLFLALRNTESAPNDEDGDNASGTDAELDEMLKTGDAVKVRISSVKDDDEDESED